MTGSSAAVLFLLHDNMDRLERNFGVVDALMQRTFDEVVYCVYENDSSDGTAEWIRDLAARRDGVWLRSERGHRPAIAAGRDARRRFERMAVCRNHCLDLARQHARHTPITRSCWTSTFTRSTRSTSPAPFARSTTSTRNGRLSAAAD